MKRFLYALVLIICFASMGAAQPFLTCDPYPTGPDTAVPDEFVIVLNGLEYISAAAIDPLTGGAYLYFDLNGLWSPGPNTTIVWARNIWGESTQVPFDFFAGVPQPPTSTRLVGSLP